jgi:octaprenyl-diphosphate synthase
MLAAETSAVTGSATVALLTPFAWKQIVVPVEPFLQAVADRLAEQIHAFDSDIAPYAEYALSGQGKQLRPALVALSASATGKIHDDHILAAVIVEMVHLATLVHDDVVDEADLRRGRPTLASNWGNEVSVLLGDCLFAHALNLAASFPTPEICRAVAAATNRVCAGEILQTHRRRNLQFSRHEYFKALEMKTGELFALSCELGGFLNGATSTEHSALRRFGLALGTAYQIYDDCLDLFGSETVAGKSLGTDLANGKLTLPVLVVLEQAGGAERAKIEHAIQRWEPRHFAQVRPLLAVHGALAKSRGVIRQYLHGAQQSLPDLTASEGRAGLYGLTEYLAQQMDALGDST